ncbi:MAG: 4Fe-4S dicluster domain-containing protein [Desulfurococcus sp.]|nr:4Fe-4S dicluster domain-containing protein [Desulfurococcus sp.]
MSKPWILVDPLRCTGCRLCEIACSLTHEGSIWPSASRIQVYEPYPGAPVPVTCVQCEDYPCVQSCPFNALKIDEKTGAVIVIPENCTLCGACVNACPLEIPRIIPGKNYVLICDLCGGEPACVKACSEAGYNALTLIEKPEGSVKVFLKDPYETSKEIYERIILGVR